MTKTEILEAINATIIPNDKQGITADSLNNVLTEIVNTIPESNESGSSSGITEEEIAKLFAGVINTVFEGSQEAIERQKRKNAELFNQILNGYIPMNLYCIVFGSDDLYFGKTDTVITSIIYDMNNYNGYYKFFFPSLSGMGLTDSTTAKSPCAEITLYSTGDAEVIFYDDYVDIGQCDMLTINTQLVTPLKMCGRFGVHKVWYIFSGTEYLGSISDGVASLMWLESHKLKLIDIDGNVKFIDII